MKQSCSKHTTTSGSRVLPRVRKRSLESDGATLRPMRRRGRDRALRRLPLQLLRPVLEGRARGRASARPCPCSDFRRLARSGRGKGRRDRRRSTLWRKEGRQGVGRAPDRRQPRASLAHPSAPRRRLCRFAQSRARGIRAALAYSGAGGAGPGSQAAAMSDRRTRTCAADWSVCVACF
jgi:hypothetical protein